MRNNCPPEGRHVTTEDLTMTNEDRIETIMPFIERFCDDTGLTLDGDGIETAVGDVISNLLHAVEKHGEDGRLTALHAIKQGIGNYVTESYITDPDDDPLGPEADVTVTVECDEDVWSVCTGGDPTILTMKEVTQ